MRIYHVPLWGVCLALGIAQTFGTLLLQVSPYPARVFQNAPPDTPVLHVTGYDDVTGVQPETLYLSPGINSSYFKVNSTNGVLSTAKKVQWSVGTTLTFFVYGSLQQQLEYKHVMIIVSSKNLYAPQFTKDSHEYPLYRYAVGESVGMVTAVDTDLEHYNNIFKYKIDDERADTYLKISSNGELRLKNPPPDSIRSLTFPLIAVDEGSPRRTGTTMINVTLLDVRQPSVFCFATELHATTVCWKNAMLGRPEVTGFELEVSGAMDTRIFVETRSDEAEVCYSVPNTEMGRQYFYRVSVRTRNGTIINRMKLMVNTTGIGFTPQCLHYDFDSCKYLKPCAHGADCRREEDGALNYQCNCPQGWQGKNCTLLDMCPKSPCKSGGLCTFVDHEDYVCSCLDNFFGDNCEHFNICSINPCQNGGHCSMAVTGSYECSCPDHFTGTNCDLRDPCVPEPCNGKGTCERMSDEVFSCRCDFGYHGNVCEETDLCLLSQPCQNNGTCTSTGNSTFVCTCPFGLTGPTCTEFDACSRDPCINEAPCELKDGGEYFCHCLPGFHGGECQHYNRCHGIDCNNGTCQDKPEGPQCVCERGYYGERCDFFNACERDNPCGQKGRCENTTDGGYLCHCADEWFGLQCQYLNSCSVVTCENGGQCTNMKSETQGSFFCNCTYGYYGDTCSQYNPCVSVPCLHDGVCTNTSSDSYSCVCKNGHYGTNCERRNPCYDKPCNYGGKCTSLSDTEYHCECSEEYIGHNCSNENPCYQHPCANEGTCEVDLDTLQRSCDCVAGYIGASCEYETCNTRKCNNGGTCEQTTSLCLCTSEYTGPYCETVITPCTGVTCPDDRMCRDGDCVCINGATSDDCVHECPQNVTVDRTGRYTWPRTDIGEVVKLPCQYLPEDDKDNLHHQRKYARRQCVAVTEETEKARWSTVDTSQCPEMSGVSVSETLDSLKSLTEDPSQVTSEQLAHFTSILEVVYYYALDKKEVAEGMTSVISNLADVNVSVTRESNNASSTSERLLTVLKDYTSNVASQDDVEVTSANINLKAVDVAMDTAVTGSISYEPNLSDGNTTVKSGISVSIPPEVINSLGSTGSLPLRVQFLGFKTSMFFLQPDEDVDDLQHQRVVTAIINRTSVRNLTTPIVYRMVNIEEGQNHTCVYWDPEHKTWLTDGIVTMRSEVNTTECHTSHLTSFAILMDSSPTYVLPVVHEQILTIISYVGCAISLIGLTLTILTYGLFRCLNKDKSGKILLNLCAAMVLMNVSFLMGAQSAGVYGAELCMGVAVLLHYFLLTTLMWMLVEALEMYQALVTVFAKYARFYMLKRCVVAWGVPLIIVVITLAIDLQHYRPAKDFCFISQANAVAYYVALVAPGCIIVLINTIVFIMVARVILKPRFQQQQRDDKERVTPAQVRGAVTVMILLGVTWIFGPLAVNEAKLVFNYLFCILNSLQGFFIFVFRCLFNPEARLAWLQLVKTGTLKRRRGPIKSVYSDTSSKGDHTKSKTNGHFNGTLKSNLMQSNGWHHPQLNGIPHENGGTPRDTQYYTGNHDTDSQQSDSHLFHTKDDIYLENNTPPTKVTDMEDGFTHL